MQTKNKQSLDFEKPLLDLEKQLDDLMQSSKESDLDFSKEIQAIEQKIELTKREVYSNLTSWQKVQLSRHPNRPYSPDLIFRIFENPEMRISGDSDFRIFQASRHPICENPDFSEIPKSKFTDFLTTSFLVSSTALKRGMPSPEP